MIRQSTYGVRWLHQSHPSGRNCLSSRYRRAAPGDRGLRRTTADESSVEACVTGLCPTGRTSKAEWAEFDLEHAEWRIPPAKMKMRRPHRVPLAKQALTIIRDLQARCPARLLARSRILARARQDDAGDYLDELRDAGKVVPLRRENA
jgi:integrase